ncbi:MAG: hypothetical protein ACE5LB_17655 [Acidiferrobacterales bacterium]
MKSKVVRLAFAAVGVILLSSCSRIEEPWVSNEDQLKQERSRSVAQQQILRQRLLLDSGFRNADLAP